MPREANQSIALTKYWKTEEINISCNNWREHKSKYRIDKILKNRREQSILHCAKHSNQVVQTTCAQRKKVLRYLTKEKEKKII
jgi:hypothetical protein